MDGKRAGEAAGKSEVNQVPAKVEEKVAESRAAPKRQRSSAIMPRIVIRFWKRSGNFTFTLPVSFVQPWLLVCREPFASFSADAKSFSSPCSFGGFLNVPLRFGALLSSCHNLPDRFGRALLRAARHAMSLAAALSCARCFLHGSRTRLCRALPRHTLRVLG